MAAVQCGSEILSDLNKDYKKSKAEQILRLLKDQECLNRKFKEFALESDDSDVQTDEETGNLTDSSESMHETERKLAETISLRRHSGIRCKTSMGFYNDNVFDGDSGNRSRDPSTSFQTNFGRVQNSNPRRRMYTNRTENIGLDLCDGEDNQEDHVIESARASSRPNSGVGIRYELSLYNDQDVDNRIPLSKDPHICRRPRLYSAKIEPVGRKTPVKGFCENRGIRGDTSVNSISSLPSRSLITNTFTPIGAVASELHPCKLLNRSDSVSGGVQAGLFAVKSRSFTPNENSLFGRSDSRGSPLSIRPRRKLPDISKAKALAVMKLPPLENSKSMNGREFLSLPKESCASDIRC